ncbi:hypothetical protein ACFQMA_15565 [Halosimplex aquaticum]|uniref:Solute:sodium symporter small subunit n=1 Tax=Halosimplex aquaticum TaxID=3026162 RepID=A0ABD5Y1G9_9EURY|nr:hypothetical protein [Halosimplex aquaticum]
MAETFRQQLLMHVCANQLVVALLLAGSVLALILDVAILVFVNEPGGAGATVGIMSLPGILFMIGWTSYALYRCRDDMPYGRSGPTLDADDGGPPSL